MQHSTGIACSWNSFRKKSLFWTFETIVFYLASRAISSHCATRKKLRFVCSHLLCMFRTSFLQLILLNRTKHSKCFPHLEYDLMHICAYFRYHQRRHKLRVRVYSTPTILHFNLASIALHFQTTVPVLCRHPTSLYVHFRAIFEVWLYNGTSSSLRGMALHTNV